jgi:CRP/FNR family transcriptional regulator, cyclic AMP receptor protein
MAEDIRALARVPLFSGIAETRLRGLASRSVVRTLSDGEVAATPADPASRLLVVERGALAAIHDGADGRRVRLGDFHGPCAVDKVAVLDAGHHTATWTAVGTTVLRLVSRDEVLALVDDVPAVRRHVLTRLAGEVRRHQDERLRASLDDATTRLAAWLMQAAAEQGRRIVLHHGQQGLGEAIGASRVTTNRALRDLERNAVVRIEHGAVYVLAPEVLAHRARSAS